MELRLYFFGGSINNPLDLTVIAGGNGDQARKEMRLCRNKQFRRGFEAPGENEGMKGTDAENMARGIRHPAVRHYPLITRAISTTASEQLSSVV